MARAAEALQDSARQLVEGSQTTSMLNAYAGDMAQFRVWCAEQVPLREALPAQPMTVALYLAALADIRTRATIRRRIGSISVVHQLADVTSTTGDAVVQAALPTPAGLAANGICGCVAATPGVELFR
jgi:hypothetical protein